MRMSRKCSGAISIFLVIVLVPMLAFSAFFVDVSRVELARGIAASAGDLALNTALTRYDAQLKELYGLFATTQNQGELFSDLEAFYYKSIISYGVGADEAGDLTGQIMAQLKEMPSDRGDASDILNIKLESFEPKIPPYGSLASPDVLERQIVEFMKYRTPINTGLRFLSALSSFSSVSKETDLVDKRQSYFKEEKNINEKLFDAWKNMAQYNRFTVGNGILSDKGTDFLDGIEEKYNRFHVRTIMDLYATEDIHLPLRLEKTDAIIRDADGNETQDKIWVLFSESGAGKARVRSESFVDLYPYKEGGYDSEHRPDADEIKSLMRQLWELYSDNKRAEFNQAREALPILKASEMDGIYDIQYAAKVLRKNLLQPFAGALADRYEKYQKFANTMIWADHDALDFSIKKGDETISATEFAAMLAGYYEDDMKASYDVFKPFADTIDRVRASGRTDRSPIDQEIRQFSKNFNIFEKNIKKAISLLEEAEKKLRSVYDSLNGGDLVQKRKEWEKTANDADLSYSSLADQDKADLRDMKNNLNKDEIRALGVRISELRRNLEKVKTALGEYAYCGVKLGDIESYEAFESILEKELSRDVLLSVSQYEIPLRDWAKASFAGKFQSGNADVGWMKDQKTGTRLFGEHQPEFYTYLYTQYSGPHIKDGYQGNLSWKTGDKDEAEKLDRGMKDSGKEEADDESKQAREEKKDPEKKEDDEKGAASTNLPSKKSQKDQTSSSASGEYNSDSEEVAGSTSVGLASMFSGVKEMFTGSSENLRDGYYVTDYILSMFSFATIEAENKDKNGGSANPPQSLRNIRIDGDHNYHYSREVEYILFGGGGSGDVAKAFGSIFAIRFGLNVIYAFSDMETTTFALSIATPLSAATFGVVPVPLFQAAIQILLALIQSAIDLGNLYRGKAVPIFHKKTSWTVTPGGLVNAARDEIKNVAKEVKNKVKEKGKEGINKAADKLGEYLDKGGDEADAYVKEKEKEILDHISESFDDLITRHANVAVSKMQSLIQNALSEEGKGTPGFNAEKYVSDKLDEWIGGMGEDPSDLSYIVKRETVKLLKERFVKKSLERIRDLQKRGVSELETIQQETNAYFQEIVDAAKKTLMEETDEIIKYRKQMTDKMKEAINEGADKVKEELDNGVDKFFGSSGESGQSGQTGGGSSGESTGISSLLSFRYSDYMRLFLLLGMFGNRESILRRTADCIQLNVSKQTNDPDYVLWNAGAYLQINTQILVKPLLMPLPLFGDTFTDPATNTSWYTIDYEGVRGY